MTSLSAPFPPAEQLLSAVRESCKSARESAKIEIDDSAVERFLRTLPRADFERLQAEHGVVFPLRFTSTLAEVNFLAVLALLNTLSAYRAAFHAATGQGAYQNVMRLCMALYLSNPDTTPNDMGKLSAAGLQSLTSDEIAQIWGVSLFQESQAPLGSSSSPAVMLGQRGGEMNDIVQMIIDLCHETGQRLQQAGFKDLGSLVLSALRDGQRISESSSISDEAAIGTVLTVLIRVVPGFADMHLLDGHQPVYLLKKAFFLLFALHLRFPPDTRGSNDLWIPKTDLLPMFVDNVIPTMVKHMSILDLSKSTSKALSTWAATSTSASSGSGANAKLPVREGPRLSKSDAYLVRASALDAGAAVVRAAHALAAAEEDKYGWMSTMTEADLDGYLWAVAKDDPELRKVPRLVERNTIMY